MAERADPAPSTRTSWPLLPVLRRMAAMPLKDPFAFTGVLIYLLFALVALFADQLAPVDPMEILFTKAGKLAANVPPGICIILVVVAGFFISRGYEEVFMPRLRGR